MWVLTSTLFTTLIRFTSAQGGFSQDFDPSDVDPAIRSQWCSVQVSTCDLLCSGSTILDSCNTTSLDYTCTCASNNSSPDLGVFTGTIPTFICGFIVWMCKSEVVGNLSEENCSALETCGAIYPTDFVLPNSTSTAESARVLNTGGPSSATTSTTSSSSGTGSTDSTTPSAGGLPRLTVPPVAASSSSSVSVPSSGGSSPNSNRLSTGAKVGIAIGILVGVFGLVLGAYLLGRRGKGDLNTHPGIAELSCNGIHEIPQLETKEKPGELEGRALPDERVYEIG